MKEDKKIYFASDFHLGAPNYQKSRLREDKIIRWLDFIATDACEIYLLGDIFDFWFEYKTVIPKGYIRLFGKLAQLTDSGIKLHIFKGNHDMWMKNYFKNELGAELYNDPIEKEINGHRFLIGHGDGLGPGDFGYKFIKWIFRARVNQWLFGWLHPDIGIRLADFFFGKKPCQD